MRTCKQCRGIPHCNDPECWDKYFKERTGSVLAFWTFAQKNGLDKCINAVGIKYVKQLKRFMEARNGTKMQSS